MQQIAAAVLAASSRFVAATALPATEFKTEFFRDDFDYMYINIETPTGYRLSQTDTITEKIEERLLQYKEIDISTLSVAGFFYSTGGSTGGEFKQGFHHHQSG